MKIALCDDEYIQVKFIEEYLRQRNDDIDYYESGEALVCAYRDGGQRYDVVFLDIEMQPVSGFDTANILYAIDDSVLIVFVTSHHQHIEEWFKFPAMWFLHKPVTEAELDEVLSRVTDKYASLRQAFTFTDSHQSVRLRCDEILYFEAQDHDIIIHKKGGDTQSFRLTMKELEEKLGKSFSVCMRPTLSICSMSPLSAEKAKTAARILSSWRIAANPFLLAANISHI